MSESMEQVSQEASARMGWLKISEEYVPRYVWASYLGCMAANSVAIEAGKAAASGSPAITPQQWEELIMNAYAVAFTHALVDLHEGE